ncbi:ABC transporter permease [Rhodococcoides kyotonense]|uniref:NitT/TauT family transport system permease protein n=1 Tax=Rhodococcoides kyotonense TaxID=398843 RepID=A0A239LC66_9NOCA|nr:ABC transporter permease subunit [Rhodococcus kyotonensis]SNT27124.1 NitT/TauT family transport system permease protein [Rhodococcus kyotonensis]
MTTTLPVTGTESLAPPKKKHRSLLRRFAPPVVVATMAVAAWWLAALVANSLIFPTPAEAMASLADDLGKAEFRANVFDSLRILVLGYLASTVVGSLLGLALGISPFWTRAILPIFYSINSIPKIVLYPIFLSFLGIGELSRGGFTFYAAFVPMFLVAVESTASVQRIHLKMAASLRVSWPRLIRQIVIPSALPALATGMRMTFGLAFLGLLLAEMFSSSSGIGYELLRNVSLVRMENIMGTVVLIMVMALPPTIALQWLENRVTAKYGG